MFIFIIWWPSQHSCTAEITKTTNNVIMVIMFPEWRDVHFLKGVRSLVRRHIDRLYNYHQCQSKRPRHSSMLLIFVPEIHTSAEISVCSPEARGGKSAVHTFHQQRETKSLTGLQWGSMGHWPHYSPKHLCHRTALSMHTHAQHTQISNERQAGPTNRMTKCIQVVKETKTKYLATEIYGKVPCCTQTFGTTHLYSHYTVFIL